ncbi:hypothetical protein [Microbacterium rhizomatis]|uniref:Uncharacterized protein n=1 Tax=Microbacterium rhizomatis TaxID=1631477 RepID=A0A5J5J0E3_9MICO|nr:hypothetical protein [Microbacterium rhizomatis]KAA9105016.1 hypothetical protein F6B43_18380 [Microbacterium rhizomatis]
MGVRLVKLAYLYALDIPLKPNEFRLLGWMSMTALDDDTTPRYFDSREASALAIGRRVVDDGYGDEADQRERAAAFEAVRVALAGLVAIGAVDRISMGRNGRRSEYAIRLDAIASRSTSEFAKRAPNPGRTWFQTQVEPGPKPRTDLAPNPDATCPSGIPRNNEEQEPGTTSSHSAISLAPVDNSAVEIHG